MKIIIIILSIFAYMLIGFRIYYLCVYKYKIGVDELFYETDNNLTWRAGAIFISIFWFIGVIPIISAILNRYWLKIDENKND